MAKEIGYKVVGTVTRVKGTCSCGHKVGDRFELSGYSPGGLCGFFYHDIFYYIVLLQFCGRFPEEWGAPDTIVVECTDRLNAVGMRLHREE